MLMNDVSEHSNCQKRAVDLWIGSYFRVGEESECRTGNEERERVMFLLRGCFVCIL